MSFHFSTKASSSHKHEKSATKRFRDWIKKAAHLKSTKTASALDTQTMPKLDPTPPPQADYAGAADDNNRLVRVRYRFVGTVQGVGFRYTMQRIATRLGLVGWVKNEDDESVTAEVEGSAVRVRSLFPQVKAQYTRYHIDAAIDTAQEIEPLHTENEFRIRM